MIPEDAEKLLMMFINDSYSYKSGKPSKNTLVAMMRYVSGDPELQRIINNGDHNAILAYRKRKPPWISVKQRLPEDGQQVLALSFYGVLCEEFNNGQFACEGIEKNMFSNIVTHWMPIPEKPDKL